jgi:hypothetical protein
MTPHPQSRIYLVEVCSDDDCPNHGEYEEKGWDESGLHPRYPYCYLAEKKLDLSVQDIPDWCPLPHSSAQSERDMLQDELENMKKDAYERTNTSWFSDMNYWKGVAKGIEDAIKELRKGGEQE